MSFNVARSAAILGLLAMGACGFAPAFAPGETAAQWQNTVVVDAPETVIGFRMGVRLAETLGQPTDARYRLIVIPKTSPVPATITADGDITRFNLTGNAAWKMTEAQTGMVLHDGIAQTFVSYSATGSTVATQAAEGDAADRLAVALADLIVQQLLTAP